MNKKMTSLTITAVVFSILLGGCQSSALKTSGDHGVISIAWWGNESRMQKTMDALDVYTDKHPEVEFQTASKSWNDYWDYLEESRTAGQFPDMIQMDYSYLGDYASRGLLVDLGPYVESGDLDLSDIPKEVLESGKVDGKLYGIPGWVNAPALVYDKTLMDSLGLTVRNEMSIEEFIALSKQVYELSGIRTDLPRHTIDRFLPYHLRGMGILEMFHEDGFAFSKAEPLEKHFEIYEQGYREGWVIPMEVYERSDYGNVDGTPLLKYDSEENRSWCSFSWSNQLSAMQAAAPEGTVLSIAAWPALDTGLSNYLKPSQFFSVTTSAGENTVVAVHAVNALVGDLDIAKILLDDRGVPSNTKCATAITSYLDEACIEANNFVTYVVSPNCSPISSGTTTQGAEVYEYADELIVAILSGEISAHQAAEDLLAESRKIFGQSVTP